VRRASKKKAPALQYAVQVGEQYISTFTYPNTITKIDKAWEKSPGVKIAPCCKAILGETPFLWPNRASAKFCAQVLSGRLTTGVPNGDLALDAKVIEVSSAPSEAHP
jgi:hypothetical protein